PVPMIVHLQHNIRAAGQENAGPVRKNAWRLARRPTAQIAGRQKADPHTAVIAGPLIQRAAAVGILEEHSLLKTLKLTSLAGCVHEEKRVMDQARIAWLDRDSLHIFVLCKVSGQNHTAKDVDARRSDLKFLQRSQNQVGRAKLPACFL